MSDVVVQETARLVVLIADSFYGSGFDLSVRENAVAGTWCEMPEVEAAGRLRGLGVSGREVRLFLTFVSAMERSRDATQLWGAAVSLWESCPGLFEPAGVARMGVSVLREALRSAGVSRFHTSDAVGWWTIAVSLIDEAGPIRRVIEEGRGHAGELLADVRSERAGKARFPLLRGPKLAPMWVRVLAAPGGAAISHLDIVPVAVDVQVRKVTENLGVADTRGLPLRREVKRRIQSAWAEAVSVAEFGGPLHIGGTCAALDPALWLFGARGCSFCEKRDRRIPISTACDKCQLFDNPQPTGPVSSERLGGQ